MPSWRIYIYITQENNNISVLIFKNSTYLLHEYYICIVICIHFWCKWISKKKISLLCWSMWLLPKNNTSFFLVLLRCICQFTILINIIVLQTESIFLERWNLPGREIKVLPHFWWDWRSIEIVANLVLFFSRDNQLNSSFSLNFQQILVNKVSNDRQFSIISYNEVKFMIFYENS